MLLNNEICLTPVTERKDLVPCDFSTLEEEVQDWACEQLFDVYANFIKRASGSVNSPLHSFVRAHSTLQGKDGALVFVNEHANKKGINPDLLAIVRGAQEMCANAGVCKDSIYCMIVAKLHEELSRVVERGDLTREVRASLGELCKLYRIEVTPKTLERYWPAGRMMLKCRALAFVNVTMLLDQQKLTEKMIENDEMVLELSNLASGEQSQLLLGSFEDFAGRSSDQRSIAATIAGLMKGLRSAAALDELETTRVNTSFSAIDLARVLGMNFGNGPTGRVGAPVVWEYASLLNAKLKNGHCLMEEFRVEKVPPKMDWIAVACFDVNVGVLLNFIERKIVVCAYEPLDEDVVQDLVKTIAEKLKFPKKHLFEFRQIGGYENVGLLHWLSREVWGCGRDANCPVELVRVQVALEMFKQDLFPQDQSFLGLIAEEQQPLTIRVEQGKELNDENIKSLGKSGFFVIRGFLSNELCGADAVSELCRRVLQCKKRQTIFQGPESNDNRRVQASVGEMRDDSPFSEELQILLDAASKKLGAMVRSRSPSDMVALLSLQGCGPQRPHADYTREALQIIKDDGVCSGLPLGVVIAFQPNTLFDIWPGAIDWDETRFYEHKQVKLGPGDAIFFLGNAVHAGAAFENENVRLHCYLDSPGVLREADTTWYMDVAAGIGNILPRGVKLPGKK